MADYFSKEAVVALGDIGATYTRLHIMSLDGETVGGVDTSTDPEDYEGSVADWAREWDIMADGRTIAAAALAIAAEVDPESGMLTKSGGLSPWLGKNPGKDLQEVLNVPVGVRNDVAAIAASQQAINNQNGRPYLGVASTLSSGWGGARFDGNQIWPDEPGHQDFKPGAICPCGEDGHAEAWISGKGVENNMGLPMRNWLRLPGNAGIFINNLSSVVVAAIERYNAADGFQIEEWRWTGSVALGQRFIMQTVADKVREQLGEKRAPAFDTATMGEQAGLHGMFAQAVELARAA